jgi:hypothetical protein
MTQTIENDTKKFGYWKLEFILCLACLREAASAKAGAWDLVILFHSIFRPSSFDPPL